LQAERGTNVADVRSNAELIKIGAGSLVLTSSNGTEAGCIAMRGGCRGTGSSFFVLR